MYFFELLIGCEGSGILTFSQSKPQKKISFELFAWKTC